MIKKFDEFVNESIVDRLLSGLKVSAANLMSNIKHVIESLYKDFSKGYQSQKIKESLFDLLNKIEHIDNIDDVLEIINMLNFIQQIK